MSKAHIDEVDRAVIRATQTGLPLVAFPYRTVGAVVGIGGKDVAARMARMLETGVIRRIGAVPNHYGLGLVANAMTVWDVGDASMARLGPQVGALAFVSHCYHRPRRLPLWRYNLFAMVHGKSRGEVDAKVAAIAALLGDACGGHEVLMSTRILKKTGLRLVA